MTIPVICASAEHDWGVHNELFYRIDGTHIIDKYKIREIRNDDDRVEIEMIDKTVVLEVVR